MLTMILARLTVFDEYFLNFITPLYRFASLKTFWKAISRTGDGWFYPMAPLIVWIFSASETLEFLFSMIIGFALDVPAYMLLKKMFKRRRPFNRIASIENLAHPIDTFSFPSGHAAAASVFSVLLVHFFPFLFWPAIIWCALVGFSRVFLGAHFLTDVLAGILLGGVLAHLVINFT